MHLSPPKDPGCAPARVDWVIVNQSIQFMHDSAV